MKYVIHLGVHQTGCDFIRSALSKNIDHLRAQGVFYVNDEAPRRAMQISRLLRRLRKPNTTSPAKTDFAQLNAMITQAAQNAGATTVLLSDENHLGAPMHNALAWGETNPGFYPRSNINLSYVLSGLAPRDTTLLLYTRNPEPYLVSLYSDAIREARTELSLEQFCRAVNFNSIDFEELTARIGALHPDMTVIARQYERVKLGPKIFLSRFLRDAGVDPAPMRLTNRAPQDLLDATQVEALLHIMAGQADTRWRITKRLRQQVLDGAPNPLAPLSLPEWVTDSMRVTAEGRDEERGAQTA